MSRQSKGRDREERLDEIIAAYDEAIEKGQVETAEEWIVRHSEFAEELREYFEDDRRVRGMMPTLGKAPLESIKSFGDYELLEELGRGGMGIVYKARQKSLNRIVAIKTIITGRLATEEDVRRFRREAQSAAKLRHPSIVTVHQVGEHNGQQFFSMECIDGNSLADVIHDRPLPPVQAAQYLKPLAEAIHYAHNQGVLHRDLKPSNVLLDSSGQPRITDFGLAKRMEDQSDLTVSGAVVGTPSYMSPEQAEARRGEVNERTDIYSLGAILYEGLTGTPPFRGRTPAETLLQVLKSEPVPPRLVNPKVPADLETICLRCLEKEPRKRYGSAEELSQDLQRFLDGEPIQAEPPGYVEKIWRWYRRHSTMVRLKTTAASIGMITGPLIAALLWFGPRIGPDLSPAQPELNTMAGIVALMAIWWVTEAIPVAATAFLPLILFPVAGIMPAAEVSRLYADDIIFLFLGGFLVAIALQETGFPRRAALNVVALVGDNPRRVILGFMVATGAMSMWMSNTASTISMLPIALSILSEVHETSKASEEKNFGIALMLGIAYAASIGGTATLIGTPPNLVFLREMSTFGEGVSFLEWMVVGLPFALALGLVAWSLLVFRLFPVSKEPFFGGKKTAVEHLKIMGPMGSAEKRMVVIAVITALLWVFREPVEGWGWASLLGLVGLVSAGTVAMVMAVVCFLVPSGNETREKLLDWKSAVQLPWGVLLLFGGGLALGQGMRVTGLNTFLGDLLAGALNRMPSSQHVVVSVLVLGVLAAVYQLWRSQERTDPADGRHGPNPRFVPQGVLYIIGVTAALAILLSVSKHVGMMLAIGTAVTFLTEVTTNLATVQMILPVLSEAGRKLLLDPQLLLVPATLAASCAFMLPVATAPNAIAYGSGKLTVRDMLNAGIWLNLAGVVLITFFVSLLTV